jgi:protease I
MIDLVLKGVRVAILATDGVEKVELTLPRLSLEEAGADTVLVAPKPQIQSMKHDEKDERFAVDVASKTRIPRSSMRSCCPAAR